MALKIQTTGLEQYASGGTARVKTLIIGGPGAGKTRMSSYFPAPIYADCEKGLASVADRNVPFVDITNSTDMLDLLAYLKMDCAQPPATRKYQTIVIDTIDAFARKVKNEWQEKERKPVFTGWEAWGFLNSRMQLLLTRLLNLDMNIVVLCHYKDKTAKDDETGRETHELMPQLQGETADMIFNDFDLVAWMGTAWKSVGGERVQTRSLTFTPTPDKPFLKDRLHVMPRSMDVHFDATDYTILQECVESRLKDLKTGETVGEIPSVVEDAPTPGGFVIAPGAAGSGALPATVPKTLPVNQMDKAALQKLARDKGVLKTLDGQPIRANTLKSELIDALEAHERGDSPEPPQAADHPATPAASSPPAQPVANPARTRQVAEGTVDTATGELLTDQAVATIENVLGGTVTEDKAVPVVKPEPARAAPTAAPVAPLEKQVCFDCGKDLAGENPDIVKLSYIRFRKRYCSDHYAQHKLGK